MANNYTVQWRGSKWQIPRKAIRPGLRGSQVRIEQQSRAARRNLSREWKHVVLEITRLIY